MKFGKELDCPENIILEVDGNVELNLENVTSEKQVKICIDPECKINLKNCSGIELIKEEKDEENKN